MFPMWSPHQLMTQCSQCKIFPYKCFHTLGTYSTYECPHAYIERRLGQLALNKSIKQSNNICLKDLMVTKTPLKSFWKKLPRGNQNLAFNGKKVGQNQIN
jgi:hypothetical protein